MIKVQPGRFVDEEGRTLLLRGVNLGGSSKVPYKPDGATWRREGFFDYKAVSFIGRPFPLEEADEHFARLKAWGFTFIRFLITWEAVEHAGPGLYDHAYLDYLHAVIEKAASYDIQVFIDPHQDAWSRFSGGDGAPGWTFELLGMDIQRFQETGAAIVHATHGDPLPRMIWPTNYGKLANLTMWTLFFGGNDFAPETRIDGLNAGEFLQTHYLHAIKQVAIRLSDLPNVIGFDTLNEPSAGLIGMADLRDKAGMLQLGDSPTAFQAMLLGAGYPQEVETWGISLRGQRQTGARLLNPDGISLWLEGFEPIWKQNGVWDVDAAGHPQLLRPAYFSELQGRRVEFYRDYFRPFANTFAREMRSVLPEAIIFIEGAPRVEGIHWTRQDAGRIVHAGHWYDHLTLITKDFRSWFTYDTTQEKLVLGCKAVRKTFRSQIARIHKISEERLLGAPTLIGEVGIPFDMHGKQAYRTGDFSRQAQALDTTMRALEDNLVSFTLWNYTADNTNARGDQWNDEDLSLFSRDQQDGLGGIHDGGRALEAAVRPYAARTAGTPLKMSFDRKTRMFNFTFKLDTAIDAPSEFFVPSLQYPNGVTVQVTGGGVSYDPLEQRLIYRADGSQPIHHIEIMPATADES